MLDATSDFDLLPVISTKSMWRPFKVTSHKSQVTGHRSQVTGLEVGVVLNLGAGQSQNYAMFSCPGHHAECCPQEWQTGRRRASAPRWSGRCVHIRLKKKAKAPTSWGSVVWISLPAPGGTTCVGAALLSMPGRTSYCAAHMFAHSRVLTQRIEHPATHHDATAVRSVRRS